jgi:hypothetical protein
MNAAGELGYRADQEKGTQVPRSPSGQIHATPESGGIEDRADVAIDRAGCDLEMFADLGVRHTGKEQFQHLTLALGEVSS